MKNQHGGDIYKNLVRLDYSVNVNPLGMPHSVQNAAKEAIALCGCYPDTEYRRLIEKLSDTEKIPMNQILCGNGAADLLFRICQAAKPKKAVLISPTFSEYEHALESVGAEISYFELEEKNDFELEKAYLNQLTSDLDLVFLCNPNNPTGKQIAPSMLRSVLERCKTNNIILVLDECFLDFLEDTEKASMKSYLDSFKQLIIVKAFTKIYGMPGLRLGYVMSSNRELLVKMERAAQPWSVSIPAMEAGIAALSETEYVKTTKKIIKREREFLESAMNQGLVEKFYKSSANYILFQADIDLKEQLLERQILIRDCSNYKGLKVGYYRIAVKKHHENEELIQTWKEITNKGLSRKE